jgi:radical SAM protein with 4Fe4S-binding SPASM domain
MTMPSSGYAPRRGVFEATLKCNLRCKHCGSRAGQARPDELTIDEIRKMFADLKALGMEWITISGGEPMSREDWPEVIDAATSAGIRAGMITNAVTLDRDAVRLAKKNRLSGIGLSLDGGVARTHDFVRGRIGHFGQLSTAMDVCREEGMPFAVITHLNTRNIGELEMMHELIVNKGAYAWQVQLGTDMGNMSDHRDMLLSSGQLIGIEKALGRMIRRSPIRIHPSDSVGYFGPNEKLLRRGNQSKHFNGCGAGKTVIGIESNGNIKGCLSIMAGYNERGQDFVEGNIRNEPLADIWHRDGAFPYTRNWTINELGGFCRTCDKAELCQGGCTAKKVASGDGVENPMCIYRALHEQKETGQYISKQAAAMTLAMLLGAGVNACDNADDPLTDTETATLTGDTGTGTDTASADTGTVPVDTAPMDTAYSMPEDTGTVNNVDTATADDTNPVLEYGMVSTDYSMPEDTATEMDSDVPDYDMPTDDADYGMPMDTATEDNGDTATVLDSDTPAYGMPIDTETEFLMEYGVVPPEPDEE